MQLIPYREYLLSKAEQIKAVEVTSKHVVWGNVLDLLVI
jgi:hypothetical protein